MSKFDKLKKENQQITADVKREAAHFQEVANEYNRVADIYQAPAVILHDIERDFSNATKLNNGVDLTFLFFATALQCVRQYLITPFEERGDASSYDKKDKNKNYQERKHKWYNPTLEEIENNPVPFDTNLQSNGIHDALKGGGALKHRLTLGHDPILGWVFGTANIATSTLTRWDMVSYHVKTDYAHKKGGKYAPQDFMTNHADTGKIFYYTKEKLLNQGIDGKLIVARSLLKEWEHLQSDFKSKNSLPFPIVAVFSPDMANKLAEYGIDTCNLLTVGKQATYATLINTIVAMIHRMLYSESFGLSQSMYEVKTRKILTYSNVIASASNIIAVAVTEAIAIATDNGDLMVKGAKYLDVGGLAVTLYRLINDYKFIKEVKLEFMEKQWYDIVLGDDYEFMREVQ